MGKLQRRHIKFCQEYVKDFNITRAAIRSGYSERSARQVGHRLLTYDDIGTEIERLMSERATEARLEDVAILRRVADIAFANITAVVAWTKNTVELRPSSALPPEVLAAVAEVTQGRHGIRVKMRDNLPALEFLAKYLRMFPIPGTAKDPLKVELTYEDQLDLSKFSDEELSRFHDVIGAIIEAQGITEPSEAE